MLFKKKERKEKNYLKFEYISAHFHIEFLYTQVWKTYVLHIVILWHQWLCQKSCLDVTLVSSSNERFKSGWSCGFF